MICQSAISSWSHADVGLVEVGVAADQLQQGRHRLSLGRRSGRPRCLGGRSDRLAGCARMSTAYWNQVRSAEMTVPTDRSLPDLTAELTTMLGSTDPVERDEIAYPILATWISEGVYDDLLAGLGDGMAAGLVRGLGESRHRLGVPAQLLRPGAGRVHRPRQRRVAAAAGQDPRVGRPGQRLAGARARRARVRARAGLGPRGRPRRRRDRRARPSRRTSASTS